jgi:hypothetical protein
LYEWRVIRPKRFGLLRHDMGKSVRARLSCATMTAGHGFFKRT